MELMVKIIKFFTYSLVFLMTACVIIKLHTGIKIITINETNDTISTVTYYNPVKGQTDDSPNITASNKKVKEGMCAVSKDLFRKGYTFGKKIHVEGLGDFVVEDITNSRLKNTVDILIIGKNKSMENRIGCKKRHVTLLEEKIIIIK